MTKLNRFLIERDIPQTQLTVFLLLICNNFFHVSSRFHRDVLGGPSKPLELSSLL